MKRNIASIMWALLATLTFGLVGCNQPEEEVTLPKFPEKITANVAAGEEFKMTIEPNMKWSLKIPSDVATYFKFIVGESERYTLNGEAGKHEITVGVAENEEFDNVRVCAIEMTMGDETQVIAELTRGSKERELAVYIARFDSTEEMFVTDENGNWVYDTAASTDNIGWVWCNEQWMQRIVVESNFKWSFGIDTPEWIDASKTNGSAGRTEIFLRTNVNKLPLEDTETQIDFCDTSDRNGDGVINSDDILVVKSYNTAIEGCGSTCNVDLASSITFNAKGECYQATSGSYVEFVNGRIRSPKGAEIFAVNRNSDGSLSKEGNDWMLLTVSDFPAEATEIGIWDRTIQLDVEINESEEERKGAIVAIPLSDKNTTDWAKYVVSEISQAGIEIVDTSEAIVVADEDIMAAHGGKLEKINTGAWPWQGAWASIPYAYKLTYRNDNSGDELIFNKEFSRYLIYGYSGIAGSTYDPESCWLTINKSEDEESPENSYLIKSRLETHPNTMPGSNNQNEATIIFYNSDNQPYALIHFVVDPDFTPYEGVDGDVTFINPEEAILNGARLEEIVKGDDDFSEEENYMGILQYRLTLTSRCKTMAISVPEYSFAYPYQNWIECELEGTKTIVKITSEESGKGRISFYGSDNYNVILQLIVVYNAE